MAVYFDHFDFIVSMYANTAGAAANLAELA